MIVYPQISNLRLVVVPLVVALLILGLYSFSSYRSIQEYQNFLEQENESVAGELNDMIYHLNELNIDNDSILSELQSSKIKMSRILDSIYSIEPDVDLVSSYKKQLYVLKLENKRILALVEDLNAENKALKERALVVAEERMEVAELLEESKTNLASSDSRYSTLSKANSRLEAKLVEASKIKARDIFVEAVKRETSNRIVSTKKAKKTRKINVCFTLSENKFAKSGEQILYLQLIDPNNNVIGDREVVKVGDSKLVNSKILKTNYLNKELKVCDFIEPNAGEFFVKGEYYVSLFSADGLIQNTKIVLK